MGVNYGFTRCVKRRSISGHRNVPEPTFPPEGAVDLSLMYAFVFITAKWHSRYLRGRLGNYSESAFAFESLWLQHVPECLMQKKTRHR